MFDLNSEKMLMGGGANFDETPVRFDYTGEIQTYVVPRGCKKLKVDCVGAKGYNGGNGGKVTTTLSVTPGETLYVWAGPYGSNLYNAIYNASDIRTSNANITSTDGLNSRLVVAGAGGASGSAMSGSGFGGAGGGLIAGGGGSSSYAGGGGGGTQNSPGGGGNNGGNTGHFGIGGAGHFKTSTDVGGAGGAGFYGGGGGGAYETGGKIKRYYAGGGGGGSSYTHPTLCSDVVHTQGYSEATGNGWVIITPMKK